MTSTPCIEHLAVRTVSTGSQATLVIRGELDVCTAPALAARRVAEAVGTVAGVAGRLRDMTREEHPD